MLGSDWKDNQPHSALSRGDRMHQAARNNATETAQLLLHVPVENMTFPDPILFGRRAVVGGSQNQRKE